MNALMAAADRRAPGRLRAARLGAACAERRSAAARRAWRAAARARRRKPRWRCPAASATTPTSTRSVHHATTIGKQFRPDNPLLPNYKWVPIGYHGRASSIVASAAQSFTRPRRPDEGARRRGADARPEPAARLRARARRLHRPRQRARRADRRSTDAESHLFGLVPASTTGRARDIQGWEYQPLGPFLVEELRQHDLAVDRDDGGAGALPCAVRARPTATRSRCPISTRPPTARRARSTSQLEVLPADRADARGRATPVRADRAPTIADALLDGRAAGGAPHRQRLQPAAGRPARLGHAVRAAADEAGSLIELTAAASADRAAQRRARAPSWRTATR